VFGFYRTFINSFAFDFVLYFCCNFCRCVCKHAMCGTFVCLPLCLSHCLSVCLFVVISLLCAPHATVALFHFADRRLFCYFCALFGCFFFWGFMPGRHKCPPKIQIQKWQRHSCCIEYRNVATLPPENKKGCRLVLSIARPFQLAKRFSYFIAFLTRFNLPVSINR